MRLVIDTNVIFSALYRPDSAPGRVLILAIEGDLELFAPETVREELHRALREKLQYTATEWEETLSALPVEWVEAGVYEAFLARATEAIADPGDASVVALALALRVGVVSGDKAFHPLRKKVVRTWRPREAASRPRQRR